MFASYLPKCPRGRRSPVLVVLLVCWVAEAVGAQPPAGAVRPGAPPPAGHEASYEWYAKQYPDPNMFTLIGPPADPGDAAVSASGQLFSAATSEMGVQGIGPRLLPGVKNGYIKNAVAFALWEEGKVVSFGSGEPARQSALRGFLPIVVSEWKHGSLSIRQTAFAEPLRVTEYSADNERTLAWAAFDLTNTGPNEQDVTFLAFYTGDEKEPRPELFLKDGAVFRGEEALFSVRVAEGFRSSFEAVCPRGASPAKGEESTKFLSGLEGVFNAVVVTGRLQPGKTTRVVVNRTIDPGDNINWKVKPEAPPVSARELIERSFDSGLEKATSAWLQLAEGRLPFETPDPALNDIACKAQLDGLILTKQWEGRYIVYDSVIYRCQWDNPSTAWIYALDVTGHHATAGRLLDTIFERQGIRKPGGTRTREGCFTDVTNINRDGSAASWASCNGWALWAITEHARLTGHREWIEKHRKQIVDGCEWIVRERGYSHEKPDNPCKGLLYGKFVCDLPPESEIGEAGYFTYTDAISFVGLNEAARLLSDWGYPEGKRLVEQSERYRADIIEAMNRLTDKSQAPWYVPWVLSAPKYQQRYFHDIVGPINLAYSCGTGGVVGPDHELIDHTIRWIVDKVHAGSVEQVVAGTSPPGLNRGSAFYCQDLALSLLERGRVDEFLRMFYTLLAVGISHGTYTTTEWGDNTQPHIHSISSVLRMLRVMLVQERGGALYLLQGTPKAWLAQGKLISIREAPTWYGPVSLTCKSDVDHQTVAVSLTMPPRIAQTPVRLRLRLPDRLRVRSATANSRAVDVQDGEWIKLQGFSGDVSVAAVVGSN